MLTWSVWCRDGFLGILTLAFLLFKAPADGSNPVGPLFNPAVQSPLLNLKQPNNATVKIQRNTPPNQPGPDLFVNGTVYKNFHQ